MTDRKVVQCNLTEATNIAPAGARAYVVLTNPGGGHDRIQVLIRSHSGRWVEKWENMRRVADFRVKTLPPEHPLYSNERLWDYDPDGTAATLNEAKRRWHSAAPGVPSAGQPPFTLHYAEHGSHHTMGSSSLLALKAEAVDMADKGWAHPEKITDSAGRVLRWNAFQINPDVDEWEEAFADRMEEDT